MKFYDFHINGKNDFSDKLLISEINRLGFDGACLFYNNISIESNNLKNTSFNKNVSNNVPFEVFVGLKIFSKNPDELRKLVLKSYKKVDVLMVEGGNLKINRAACENPRIDILSRPYNNRRDSGINHILAKEAEKNNVIIELCLNDLIKTKGHFRSKTITQFRDIILLSNKFKFNIILTSGAKTIYDLRTPQDMLTLIKSLGLTQKEAEKTLSSTPELIIKNIRERHNLIIKGVKKLN